MRSTFYSILLTVFFLTLLSRLSAQNYSMTTSTGNVIVPGTTLVSGSQGDDLTVNIPLPFTYQAYGTNYNSVNVSSNGNIQFTTNTSQFSNICPLPSSAVGVSFLPHWDDLHTGRASGQGIYTSVTGVAPNRVFNIEWRAELFSPSSNAITVNFQALLFEGQQRVDFIYGSVQNNGASASIGVQNAPAGLQTTFSCNSSSLSAGLGISFTLTACSGVPSPGFISGPAGTVCTNTPVTLTLNGYSNQAGITLQWRSSPTSGGPYTAIPGATTPSYTFTTGSTAYFIVTVTCTTSGFSANTTEFALNVVRPVHNNVLATPPASCSPGSTTITATASGGSGNYTHSMSGPGTIVQNPPSGAFNANASFTVTNLPAGLNRLTLTSTDALGCSVSTVVPVTVNPTPNVVVTPAAPVICNGAIQQLTASVTAGYAISTSTGNSIVPGTTLVPGSQGDDVVVNVALPFTYQAFGNSYASVNLSSNGNLQFTTGSTSFSNICPLPSSILGIAFLPHWDDLHTGRSPSEGIYTSVSGVAPNRIFNIEWRAEYFSPTTNAVVVNFQARLYEGQQRVDFIYGNVQNAGAGASIGIQNFAAGSATTYSCNLASLSSGLGVTFSAPMSPLATFSPVTELYTDPAATIPYTGTPVQSVYARPTVTRTYTASYTSPEGCNRTTNVTVTVNQLPAITTQPQNLAAPLCPGFNAVYSVTATGTGITYQWQVSTDNGTTWSNLSNSAQYGGVTTNSLTVFNVTTSMNNYRYRVVVSGVCAPPAISSQVTLVVATPPTITSITTNPTTPTICAGSNISFTVNAGGVPAPTIYQWQVSTDGGATWTNLTTGGSFTPTFTLTGTTTAMNNYRYRVLVTNTCGQTTTSSSVTLTVNPSPTVVATDLFTRRICISDSLIPLVGTPVGGSWSGIGVSGFNFVPPATAVGNYVLTYTFTNSSGCTASDTTRVFVQDCPERARLLRDDAVILYPNPNNGQFNLRIRSTLYNYLGLRVYTEGGSLVRIINLSGLGYDRVVPINLTDLPGGVYMVKVYYDDGVRTAEKSFRVIVGRN
ncbi:MAG TPA: hypothetical protein VEB63_02345 [Chitinophagaceae bacterium]|nr:hypothetical protein [Chitinophagaceae bacterium]